MMPEPTQSEEVTDTPQNEPPILPPVEEKEPSEVVIRAADMHKAEKAQLKLMLAVKDEQLAQVNLAHAAQTRQAAKEASDQVREEIEQKYGIDLMKHDIDEATGKLVQKRQPQIDPALLQKLMGR